MDDRPTAIFAGNNQLTLGVISAVKERNLRIPDDMAVVGFDDAPWAELLASPLTTIRQPTYEMGRRAAELLFSRMAQPDRMPALITLRPELVIRRSCGAA
jgi:LacI family transcriptional regulator/LacI family repressor for deo operon, udp, cdd, tsx, nupC, and nupG